MPYRSRHMPRRFGVPHPHKFYSRLTIESVRTKETVDDGDEEHQIRSLRGRPGGLSREEHEIYDNLLKCQEGRHDNRLEPYRAELESYFSGFMPMPKPLPKSSMWLDIYYPRHCPWDDILPWCLACADGDLGSVKRWLADKKDWLGPDAINDGLACAADGMQAEVCDYLLCEAGAIIHGAVVSNACRSQSVKVFQVLLRHGYHPDQQVPSRKGCYGTALKKCLATPELAKLLLEHGADPNVGTWTDGRAQIFSDRAAVPMDRTSGIVLDTAADCYSLEVMKALLEYGANTEYSRPLIWLISARNQGRGNQREPGVIRDDWRQVADILLENGANINEVTSAGGSPLYRAIRKDRWDIVRYLLIRGADPRVMGTSKLSKPGARSGPDALMCAAKKAGVGWEFDEETQRYVAYLMSDEDVEIAAPVAALRNPLVQFMQHLKENRCRKREVEYLRCRM